MTSATTKPQLGAQQRRESAELPLQNGDHLSRDEFERRYALMPPHIKAELLEGVVYMPPPVFEEHHGTPHFDVVGWLSMYRGATPGVIGGDNTSFRFYTNSDPQPDAHLRISEVYGGQSRRGKDKYVEGGPEFIVEVAASSVSYDLHVKLNIYRRNNVREYVVWRSYDQQVDWFILRGDEYDRLLPGSDSIYRSEIFPGLWLDPTALVRGDFAAVQLIAARGLATPEHAAFVANLDAIAKSQPKA